MGTICGIDEGLFKQSPTPGELAKIVAHWNSTDQADFLIALGEEIRNCCGGRHFMQWQYIADAMKEREAELCDGSGSQLLSELSGRMEPIAA